jgi:hypothetical protein
MKINENKHNFNKFVDFLISNFSHNLNYLFHHIGIYFIVQLCLREISLIFY